MHFFGRLCIPFDVFALSHRSKFFEGRDDSSGLNVGGRKHFKSYALKMREAELSNSGFK